MIKPSSKLTTDVDHLLKLQRELTQLETEFHQTIVKHDVDLQRIQWRRESLDSSWNTFSEKWGCFITDRPVARRASESCNERVVQGESCS